MMKTIKTILFILAFFIAGASLANAGSGSGSVTVDIAYTVTATATAGGTITPSTQTVKSGATAMFTVSPISTSAYKTTVTGCNGVLAPFSNPSTFYKTGPITGNCTVSAVFTPTTHTVTATATSGGTITPSSRTVNHGSTTTFTVSPNSGYDTAVTGCSGTLAPFSNPSTTYTTGTISANCSVSATFTLKPAPPSPPTGFSAVPSTCGTGKIDLSWDQSQGSDTYNIYTVKDGSRIVYSGPKNNSTFPGKTKISDTGLVAGSAHDYSITLSKTTSLPYLVSSPATIPTVYAPAVCPPPTFTVTGVVATSGGTITPASRTVANGAKATFTLTPNSGYSVDYTTTTCSGSPSTSGNTYTTGAIDSNCSVTVDFKTSTTSCPNGATNPPTCTTCPVGSTMISGSCKPVTVSVTASPATYNKTPNASVSFTYTPTTNTGITECRLLDYNFAPLTSTYQRNSPIIRNAPNNVGSYGYYVQCRNTTSTSVTATSNKVTVNVAVAVCANGANNPPTCTIFTPCANGANNPPLCTIFTPCANGATNPPACNVFATTTGTLTGSDCTIPLGNRTCPTSLTLSVSNPVSGAQTNITKPTNIQVASGITPATKTGIVVDYPSTTFYLNHNGATLNPSGLRINATCGANSWDGAKCVAGPVPDVDGEWIWGDWSECTAKCDEGLGTTTRTAVCIPPTGNGAPCPGPGVETKSCSSICGGSGNVLNITFTPTPDKIFKGRSSTLTWTSNADSCAITNNNSSDVFNGGKDSNPATPIIVTPTKTTTYTLTCSKGGTEETAVKDVKVSSITVIEK